jgi:hypothetical protein
MFTLTQYNWVTNGATITGRLNQPLADRVRVAREYLYNEELTRIEPKRREGCASTQAALG